MKYINFSLWGQDSIYNIGMLKNISLAKEIYPDWKVCVYYRDISESTLNMMKKNDNVIIINMDGSSIPGMFWRFAPLDDYEYAIIRDADSRINRREYNAVQEWIQSGKTLHIMRDHPHHGRTIMGGMWGIKKDDSFNLKKEIVKWLDANGYDWGFDYDQYFLRSVIYPYYANDQICHDSCYTEFPNSKPFPTKLENLCFIGEKFHANDMPFHQRQDWVNRKEIGHE